MTNYETHSICKQRLDELGGKAPCCECSGHSCVKIEVTPKTQKLFDSFHLKGKITQKHAEEIMWILEDEIHRAKREMAEEMIDLLYTTTEIEGSYSSAELLHQRFLNDN